MTARRSSSGIGYEDGPVRVVVHIPMAPPRECNPNFKGYRKGEGATYRSRTAWVARSKAVKHFRQMSWAAGREFVLGRQFVGGVLAKVEIDWPKYHHKLDASNAASSCKAAIDGLTDAGFWADDKHVHVLVVAQRLWSEQDRETHQEYRAGRTVIRLESM